MTILLAIFVFGFLIFIHEGGHYIAARLCGVTVDEFSIGFGPKLISWISKKHGTRFSLRLLPIGGYVRMPGENDETDDPNGFCKKSVPKRMLIIVMGALMNLLFGFLLMIALVFLQKTLVSTRVAEFNDNAVSCEQIMVDDEILKIGRIRVHTGNEVLYEIADQGDEPVDVTVRRNGEKLVLKDVSFGHIQESGVVFGDLDFKMYRDTESFGNYLKHSFWRSVSTVKMIYDSLFHLLTGRYGIEAVSGPIGVTEAVSDAAKSGWESMLYFISVIAINLGLFNLLPFPALDGGQFVFLAIEGVRGKPVSKTIQNYITMAGLCLLFAFMAIISVKDIIRLFIR